MNYKKNIIISLLVLVTIALTSLNVNNKTKTNLYLFTTKIEQISLGNILIFSFLSGYTFSSIFVFISNYKKLSKHQFKVSNEDKYEPSSRVSDEIDNVDNRPPERDIRDSQPTISVNYRFIDKSDGKYASQNDKNNSYQERYEDDWNDTKNDW